MITKLLSVKETAKALGISVSTIYRFLRHDPNFPRAIKLTRKKTVFKEEDISRWVFSLKTSVINSKTRN